MGRHSLSWIAAAIVLWVAVVATAAPPTKQAPASYEGLVKPGRSVVMKAPVEERVSRIAVTEASVVSEGTILAVMDRRVQESVVELASWRAANAESVTFAELDLREAELRLQQAKEAFEAEAANELELQTARIERDRAAAKLREAKRKREQARLELELERRRLERHEITAPFDAVVKRIRGEVGASLRQGEPILELVAVDPLEAEIYLPAGLYGLMEVGQTYRLSAGDPVSEVLSAKLSRVSPVIDPGSRRFWAVFEIENDARRLPPGFSVVIERSEIERIAEQSSKQGVGASAEAAAQ